MVKLSDVFKITYGVNLELCRLEETDCETGIRFVSRTAKNNGVSAYVRLKDEVKPNPGKTISVALSGSVLEAFYQDKPYYSGRDIAFLTPLEDMNEITMLYYCTVIKHNQFKYNYGRGANTTLKDLIIPSREELPSWLKGMKLPDVSAIPDYFLDEGYDKACWYLDNIDMTSFKSKYEPKLDNNEFVVTYKNVRYKKFKLIDLFVCNKGKRLTSANQLEGDIPLVTAGYLNTGIKNYISNSDMVLFNNSITIDMFGNCFYRDYEFCCDDNIVVLSNPQINKYCKLYISFVIGLDKFRFNYGRQYRYKIHLPTHTIKLPIDNEGNPNWEYMTNYIKRLNYSKMI